MNVRKIFILMMLFMAVVVNFEKSEVKAECFETGCMETKEWKWHYGPYGTFKIGQYSNYWHKTYKHRASAVVQEKGKDQIVVRVTKNKNIWANAKTKQISKLVARNSYYYIYN